MENQQKKRVWQRGATSLLAAAALSLAPTLALAASQAEVHSFQDMLSQGSVDGQLRALYYDNNNAFFASPERRYVLAYGGMLGFTSASWSGFSARASFYAQRHGARSDDSVGWNRDLGPNLNPLAEAYVQWQGDKLLIRAGDQKLNAPFTGTYDFRIVPQTYQGVKVKYGSKDNNLTAIRVFRYKSRIANDFTNHTNYNKDFNPFSGISPDANTDGFWAVGAHGATGNDAVGLEGQAWYFKYLDYANLYYGDATATLKRDGLKPFVSIQYANESETGDALVGNIDNNTYGARLGVKYNSVTASLSYNHMSTEKGTFLGGGLATPYASQESSGPLFAQPFLQSTQDLGAGDAYSFDLSGATFANTFMGARYTYVDFAPSYGADSRDLQEYMLFAIYNFQGALKGFSVSDFFAYETQNGSLNGNEAYLENRLSFQYDF